MHAIDWLIVVVLNGAVIVYAMLKSRDTETSSDWFLAGRSLPWWVVGLSLYATCIDSTDLVVDAGAAYGFGMAHFVANWVGVVGGWLLLAHFVALPMYRAGMYTNAEYLEARFGPSARAVSVIVQVAYRTVIIGMIGTAGYLTLSIVCGWSDPLAWSVVGAIALIATVYTMIGGLKSVAITDALQSFIMLAASVILFFFVWGEVGGWSGIEARLEAHKPGLAKEVLHVGSGQVATVPTDGLSETGVARELRLGGKHDTQRHEIVRRTPAWLVILSLIIAGVAYAVVNHTQSMRLFGSRSIWDLKMSVVLAAVLLIAVSFFNLTLGVMGRALHPDLATLPVDLAPEAKKTVDMIFPVVLRDFTTLGLKGIVVAGIFAAAFSTYDSIGSTLSALITRELYARLLVKDRDDAHYLAVGRWLTPLIILGSFAYVPFLLQEGMIFVYLRIVGAFVVPLMTIYLMGIFTRVHRSSGTTGLCAGFAYGVVALVAPGLFLEQGVALLPMALMDGFTTGPMTMGVTAVTQLLVSLVKGFEPRGELLHEETSGWLRRSQIEVQQGQAGQDSGPPRTVAWLPGLLGITVLTVALVLSFWVFW